MNQSGSSFFLPTARTGTMEPSIIRSRRASLGALKDSGTTMGESKGDDTIESLPQQASSNRSASTGRAIIMQQRRHFLSGISLVNFSDVMDIPDPPTPDDTKFIGASMSENDRRRRRFSSPLQDIHANSSPSLLLTQEPQNRKKKRRTSLCHVASPVDPPLTSHTTSSTKQQQQQPPKSPEVQHEKNEAVYQKRPPRPEASTRDTQNSASSVALTAHTTKRRRRHHSLLPPAKRRSPEKRVEKAFVPPDAATMLPLLADIRALVHAYTNNPNDAENLAKIQQLTGYIVTPPLSELPAAAPSAEDEHDVYRRKMELWTKLGPSLKYLDSHKQLTTEATSAATGCRYEKHRGGTYKYYCTDTGTRIQATEYEARYLKFLESQKSNNNQWADYFAKLRSSHHQDDQHNTSTGVSANNNNDKVDDGNNDDHQKDDSKHCKVASAIDKDNTINSDDDDAAMKVTDKPIMNGANAAEGCDDTSSTDAFNNGPQEEEVLLPSEAVAFDDDDDDTVNLKVAVCITEANEPEEPLSTDYTENGAKETLTASPRGENCGKKDDDDAKLLPLPSRDETSTNPEIAQAEQRLWKAIDTALETYSQEVMDIQRRHAAGS